jgi:hypothetical protein
VRASARDGGEITQRPDGRIELDGHAAAAIATRLKAARLYARVPELPFTTRSLTRSEHRARGRAIAAAAAAAYVLLVAVVAPALLAEGDSAWRLAAIVVIGLALGAGPLVLFARLQVARSAAYRDPLLTLTIAADRFSAHEAALTLIDAPWREVGLFDLTYDKAGMRYGFVVELAGVRLEHGGRRVTIDPAWVIKGRAAATAVVTRLIAARRLVV